MDVVTYGGQSWIALRTNIGVTPVEGADWTLMAAKGDTGSQERPEQQVLRGNWSNWSTELREQRERQVRLELNRSHGVNRCNR